MAGIRAALGIGSLFIGIAFLRIHVRDATAQSQPASATSAAPATESLTDRATTGAASRPAIPPAKAGPKYVGNAWVVWLTSERPPTTFPAPHVLRAQCRVWRQRVGSIEAAFSFEYTSPPSVSVEAALEDGTLILHAGDRVVWLALGDSLPPFPMTQTGEKLPGWSAFEILRFYEDGILMQQHEGPKRLFFCPFTNRTLAMDDRVQLPDLGEPPYNERVRSSDLFRWGDILLWENVAIDLKTGAKRELPYLQSSARAVDTLAFDGETAVFRVYGKPVRAFSLKAGYLYPAELPGAPSAVRHGFAYFAGARPPGDDAGYAHVSILDLSRADAKPETLLHRDVTAKYGDFRDTPLCVAMDDGIHVWLEGEWLHIPWRQPATAQQSQ